MFDTSELVQIVTDIRHILCPYVLDKYLLFYYYLLLFYVSRYIYELRLLHGLFTIHIETDIIIYLYMYLSIYII